MPAVGSPPPGLSAAADRVPARRAPDCTAHALETAAPPSLGECAAHDRAQPPALALRWAVAGADARVFGALALWAFEFGKEIAGLDRHSHRELAQLRIEVTGLRADNERARAIAEHRRQPGQGRTAAQERLAQQVRQLEADKQALQSDLGFFEA
jgi:hypothetical protein